MSKDDVLKALERIQGLRDESRGVYGFHLNGDVEDWDYFEIDQDLETIRAYINQPTDEGWRPIESAPKDGTRIKCLVLGTETILHWDHSEPDEYEAAWVDDDLTDWSPTHWMPLPQPPLQQPDKGDE